MLSSDVLWTVVISSLNNFQFFVLWIMDLSESGSYFNILLVTKSFLTSVLPSSSVVLTSGLKQFHVHSLLGLVNAEVSFLTLKVVSHLI